METDMLHSAASALLIILDPIRMLYLFGGVCMGLSLGILPGIGWRRKLRQNVKAGQDQNQG